MTVLRLHVNTGYSFLVRQLQRYALEIVEVGDLIAAKLHSPLVFCAKCPEDHHLQETICFSPQAADSTHPGHNGPAPGGSHHWPNSFPFSWRLRHGTIFAHYRGLLDALFAVGLCIVACSHKTSQTMKNTNLQTSFGINRLTNNFPEVPLPTISFCVLLLILNFIVFTKQLNP